MNWKCHFGFHKFDQWSTPKEIDNYKGTKYVCLSYQGKEQFRECSRCGIVEKRKV